MNATKIIRPSPKLAHKFRLYVWIVFLICFFPFVFLGFVPELGWLYVVIFLAANAAWMALAYLLIPPYYRSIEYELGEEEIVARRGILTKTVETVPYRTVTNVALKRGPLDRLLGIGGLLIHTAGYSAQTTAEARLGGLENYEAVHREVLEALRRYRARMGTAIGVTETRPIGEDSSELLRQILDEIKALRRSIEKE